VAGLRSKTTFFTVPVKGSGALVLVGEVHDTSVEVCLQVSTPRKE
jgi:hypothetical protein